MNPWFGRLKQATYNTTFMYNVRMLIAFTGTAFVPYLLNFQLATIPLTLGVVAAGISDIDDRFSVRIMNLIYTYIGFFITAASVQLLFPYPAAFAIGLIVSCIGWILLGSLGRRYATIAYGCLVVSVYSMLGVHLFEQWYLQPALLVAGAAWYGLLSTISFLLFPVRKLQDQLSASYHALGSFLFAKSNLFDVDMTPSSYQQSMIDLALEKGKLISIFNDMRMALLTRLIDTIIGCALAWFGVSFIWPDWKFRRLPRTIQRSLQAQCKYLAEVVTQYHEGRNNALNYRVVRRAAHNNDAEVASLISTLATEPNIDPTKKAQAFEFLCLSHTFLSYIAALGAHRERIDEPAILSLLDQALDDIQGALLRDEVPDLSSQNMLQSIRERLSRNDENDQKSLIILQQLSLILSILTRLSMLKQSLSYEPHEDGTEFASL